MRRSTGYIRSLCKLTAAALAVMLLGSLLATSSSAVPYPSPLPPGNIAIYYGFPSLINGSAGDLNAAAAVLNDYDVVVLGDGLQFPQFTGAMGQISTPTCDQNSHDDHDNTVTIIGALDSAVYGYIAIGGENTFRKCPPNPDPKPLSIAEIKARIDAWDAMGADGVFLDEAEYSFGVSRARQNEIVDYAHGLGLNAFMNTYHPDDAFSPAVVGTIVYSDGQLDGETSSVEMNPTGAATHLGGADLYLLEGFQVSLGAFEDPNDWVDRSDSAAAYRAQFGTLIATAATTGGSFDQGQLDYAWWSTFLYGFDFAGWGEQFFSASDSLLPFRTTPNPIKPGAAFTSAPMHAPPLHTTTTSSGTITVNTGTHTGSFTYAVGGVAELPDTVEQPLTTAGTSNDRSLGLAGGIAAGVAAAALALGGTAWYARKRRAR